MSLSLSTHKATRAQIVYRNTRSHTHTHTHTHHPLHARDYHVLRTCCVETDATPVSPQQDNRFNLWHCDLVSLKEDEKMNKLPVQVMAAIPILLAECPPAQRYLIRRGPPSEQSWTLNMASSKGSDPLSSPLERLVEPPDADAIATPVGA